MSELVNVPPNSSQAEQSVIGALLLDNGAWPRVQGTLTAADFYQRRHQILWNALGKLLSTGNPADILTVDEYIKSKGHAETVGGLAYIGMLAKDTPSAANIGAYAQIVRDKSTLRQLLTLSGSIRELATAEGANAKEALAQAEREIFDLAQRDLRGKKGFSRLRDVLREVIDKVETNCSRPATGVLGVSSGFIDLDAYTSGYNGGDLIVLAARPSMGKTALAMNFAETAALDGKVVAVYSLEMQAIQLGERLLAGNSGVGLKKLRESWKLEDADWPLLTAGMLRIGELPLYVDDSPGLTLAAIRSHTMKLNLEIRDEYADGIGMIIIDYLQLMGSDNERQGNRNNEIEDITRGLKKLAKELDVPIVVLSQLNRNLESRPNKRPLMSDLRDSGGIEQDADLILFLYRDEVYNQDSLDKGLAELIIGKQRNGPLGTVRLQFDGANVRFLSLVRPGGYDADRFG